MKVIITSDYKLKNGVIDTSFLNGYTQVKLANILKSMAPGVSTWSDGEMTITIK